MKQSLTPGLTVATADEIGSVDIEGEMAERIGRLLDLYPTKQAALLPVLWACQEEWGWLSPKVLEKVAGMLDLSPAFVESVVTFYTMYRTSPPGKYHLQVCTTLSCQLCGAGEVVEGLKKELGIDFGETTHDKRFSLVDVQCLGACGEGPVVQINNDYHTRLASDDIRRLLDSLE